MGSVEFHVSKYVKMRLKWYIPSSGSNAAKIQYLFLVLYLFFEYKCAFVCIFVGRPIG